jgi:hypothetical protein
LSFWCLISHPTRLVLIFTTMKVWKRSRGTVLLFLTTALEGGGWSMLYRGLGGPQGRYGWVWSISLPPEVDPQTVQESLYWLPYRPTIFTTRSTQNIIYITSSHLLNSHYNPETVNLYCNDQKKIICWQDYPLLLL